MDVAGLGLVSFAAVVGCIQLSELAVVVAGSCFWLVGFVDIEPFGLVGLFASWG